MLCVIAALADVFVFFVDALLDLLAEHVPFHAELFVLVRMVVEAGAKERSAVSASCRILRDEPSPLNL